MLYKLFETIGSLFSGIYQVIYKMADYTGVALTSAVIFGACLYVIIISLAKMHAPTPDRQITLTWEYVSAGMKLSRKKDAIKNRKAIDAEHRRETRELDKQKFIETSYRRLGKTYNYDDYKRFTAQYQLLGLMLGTLIIIIAMIAQFIPIAFIGIVFMGAGIVFGETILYSSLNGSIKKLNLREKVEMPILISRYIAIATNWKQYPLRDVLYTYLPYAGALKYDIEATLADIKSFGDMMALDLWQARATHHFTTDMMELTQFIEKLKKLYSKGDEIYVRNELSMLQRTIDEKYVNTHIEKVGRRNTLILIVLMVSSFICAGMFFMIPKLMEILDALNNSFQ